MNDEGVTRYRPKIVLADHHIDTSGAMQRGLREMRRAVARSSRFTAVVRTWFRSDGTLWDLNQLTRVTASRFGIDQRDLLICQVEFSLDAQKGETMRLILAPVMVLLFLRSLTVKVGAEMMPVAWMPLSISR
ncbi:phage baseplate assembly protein [Escherichia coli]|uniref:phage baseplate assembly protein n=1 Tax=Escherichia coli TaxID=562 RepID=UPI003890F998